VSQKNEPTMASCSFDKRGLILIILGKQHQHTFKKYNAYWTSRVCSLLLTLFAFKRPSCNRNDAKHNAFSLLDYLFVALKKAGFILADVQSDVPLHAYMEPLFPLINIFVNDILWYASPCPMRRCFKSLVPRHFRCSYLKANKVSKSEGTRKVEYVDNF